MPTATDPEDALALPRRARSRSGYALNDAAVELDPISGEDRELLEAYFGENAWIYGRWRCVRRPPASAAVRRS